MDVIIANSTDPIAVTGSNGFVGSRVVEQLLRRGFSSLRCFVRPSSDISSLTRLARRYGPKSFDVIPGNLQSRLDCKALVAGTSVLYHLAAGRGEKSYPDAYMNSVVTTRNLLDAVVEQGTLRRFVNVSSLVVYSNKKIAPGGVLDESCEVEQNPHLTGDPYCYAKVRQEELVAAYGRDRGVAYVNVRPGVVYGPGNRGLPGRVGIATFGVFLHLGGSNRIPLSYVDNCADAIVLAGLKPGIDGENLNVIDDDLPTSRQFLRMYKRNVGDFASLYLPHSISRGLSYLWEKYSEWSEGQLPPAFNRMKWSSYWKGNTYPNDKAKTVLGWEPAVGYREAFAHYCEYQRLAHEHAHD